MCFKTGGRLAFAKVVARAGNAAEEGFEGFLDGRVIVDDHHAFRTVSVLS